MVRQGYLAMLVAVGVLLVGCGGRADSGAGDSQPTETARALAPQELIGYWTIVGVDDPGADRTLRLAHRSLTLFGGRCGTLGGSWRADPDGAFLADIESASGTAVDGIPGCERASQEVPDWLRRVTAYEFDARGWPALLDGWSRPVARLVPGTPPTAVANIADSELVPPVVTDDARRDLSPAVALPVALTPVDDAQRLSGRWVPARGNRSAYVTFMADGEWRGSDGCNDESGRWITAAGGTLLATGRSTTLMGCADSVPIGYWLWTARRAGFDGQVLVLLDAQGRETGRLHRAD